MGVRRDAWSSIVAHKQQPDTATPGFRRLGKRELACSSKKFQNFGVYLRQVQAIQDNRKSQKGKGRGRGQAKAAAWKAKANTQRGPVPKPSQSWTERCLGPAVLGAQQRSIADRCDRRRGPT